MQSVFQAILLRYLLTGQRVLILIKVSSPRQQTLPYEKSKLNAFVESLLIGGVFSLCLVSCLLLLTLSAALPTNSARFSLFA